ncbi:hypothetical protein BCR41DRAFT_112226 [Lobosporangium transversale]|uniref:Uncharacterized protein n=1 Tax=Lobosporangium transversale TaxID=64571 RepID=A0A1Y2GHS8_9FUNG|nr:hypothetical protein BCR41DRAFT_112226 [Lobosporangium transversale]ORZ11359.1 hypothetical protein BCR41DRAFT_112226 [Lobosporangium transversale]|eukprot:XP_021879674.1 hypothetical protein BCR41DRAFT_112226 [Lobosporangium transversale]
MMVPISYQNYLFHDGFSIITIAFIIWMCFMFCKDKELLSPPLCTRNHPNRYPSPRHPLSLFLLFLSFLFFFFFLFPLRCSLTFPPIFPLFHPASLSHHSSFPTFHFFFSFTCPFSQISCISSSFPIANLILIILLFL